MRRSLPYRRGGKVDPAVARVAAIDCGTNSIRLLIADLTPAGMREIVREMEIVRLGEEVDARKSFKPEAIERTLSAVARYRDEMRRRGVERIRFCATSATRDASNRDLFIDGVMELIGVKPEVIPGLEEKQGLHSSGRRQDVLPRMDLSWSSTSVAVRRSSSSVMRR